MVNEKKDANIDLEVVEIKDEDSIINFDLVAMYVCLLYYGEGEILARCKLQVKAKQATFLDRVLLRII